VSKGLVPMPSDQLVASLATRLNSDVSTSACRVHKSCNELASSLATSYCESFFVLPTRSSLLPRLHLLDKGGDEGRT